ncbi:MAG TPA: dihydrolipoamide acetyltransferase family protein [Syntrophobacter fumaroxidans]|nr:dihydrolipoamide acetyltransferase family protein [Syntrophobacter fumaroxidans]
MSVEFRLPDLGEGIHEGEIVEVLVSVGDRVLDGQPVMVVETDKATTEVPAPVSGVVKEIRVKPGEVVKVGTVLMTFEAEGRAVAVAPPEKGVSREKAGGLQAPPAGGETRPAAAASKEPPAAAPSTRRLARELGIDLRQVAPSGPGGRVTPEDVRRHAEIQGRKPAAPAPQAAVAEEEAPIARTAAPEAAPTPPPAGERLGACDPHGAIERVPLRSVRRATAKHLARAWAEIPHVSHQDVADITELDAFRRKHKAEIREAGGALNMIVFVLKAAVAALKAFPGFNASIDPEREEIVFKRYYNIGVAVDTDRGLIVPVIRDVDRKSVRELAVELLDVAERTRRGKAEREEMTGGTFTLTNIGALGGTAFTPIINHPQSAILGMGQARLQPVVRGDLERYEIVPRLRLPLIVAFDHRIVDGADAARFLGMIIEALENPEELLLVI